MDFHYNSPTILTSANHLRATITEVLVKSNEKPHGLKKKGKVGVCEKYQLETSSGAPFCCFPVSQLLRSEGGVAGLQVSVSILKRDCLE